MTVFYRKVGRKYEPVSEYDHELTSAFPKGAHLVVTVPGGQSTRYNIDPALGPMIAAGKYAEDAVSNAIYKASELRPASKEITPEQRRAFDAFLDTMPRHSNDRFLVTYGSARDAAEAGVEAMMAAAQDLMLDPRVQAAWDHFLLLAKLAKEQKHGS